MISAQFTFHPDLDHFLPHPWRSGTFDYLFTAGQSVKHLVEVVGVPHTEVGLIQANGETVGFDYQVRDSDWLEIWRAVSGRGEQPDELHFVLDGHLGRLSAYLRILGFDCIYRNDFTDEYLADISSREDRILLTRDRRLLMRKIVRYGYCLRSLDSRRQLDEVVHRYGLARHIQPFRRCLHCNTLLRPVAKADILDQLEPLTKLHYEEFHRCPGCGQVYWKGSHYEHMQRLVEQVQGENP
jgi:uncharacterized protein